MEFSALVIPIRWNFVNELWTPQQLASTQQLRRSSPVKTQLLCGVRAKSSSKWEKQRASKEAEFVTVEFCEQIMNFSALAR